METVNDIIKEIRGKIETSDGSSPAVTSLMSIFIDRLDAAYKRDMQSMVEAGEIDMRTAMDEVERLREALYSDEDYGHILKERDAEIMHLKAALKPVLEVCLRIRGDYVKYKCWDPDEMKEAIVESQRIYNGGAK